jgi:hypothetical protein
MLIKERDINCPNGRKKVFLTDQEKQQWYKHIMEKYNVSRVTAWRWITVWWIVPEYLKEQVAYDKEWCEIHIDTIKKASQHALWKLFMLGSYYPIRGFKKDLIQEWILEILIYSWKEQYKEKREHMWFLINCALEWQKNVLRKYFWKKIDTDTIYTDDLSQYEKDIISDEIFPKLRPIVSSYVLFGIEATAKFFWFTITSEIESLLLEIAMSRWLFQWSAFISDTISKFQEQYPWKCIISRWTSWSVYIQLHQTDKKSMIRIADHNKTWHKNIDFDITPSNYQDSIQHFPFLFIK